MQKIKNHTGKTKKDNEDRRVLQKMLLFLALVLLSTILYFLLKKETPSVAGSQPKEGEGVVCTQEAMACPDGSFVSRQGPHCDFAPCPQSTGASGNQGADTGMTTPPIKTNTAQCTFDAKLCPDGTYVDRVSTESCEFKKCPGTKRDLPSTPPDIQPE